jgi:8-oxo-dGTP diphosphatase
VENSQAGAIVILHKYEKVLLQLRSSDAPLFPSCWGAFGGHIEEDEDPVTAATREIAEEIGVRLDQAALHQLGVINVLRGNKLVNIYCFSAPLELELGELKLTEGDGFGLFAQKEIHNLSVTPETRLAIGRHFMERGFGWDD